MWGEKHCSSFHSNTVRFSTKSNKSLRGLGGVCICVCVRLEVHEMITNLLKHLTVREGGSPARRQSAYGNCLSTISLNSSHFSSTLRTRSACSVLSFFFSQTTGKKAKNLLTTSVVYIHKVHALNLAGAFAEGAFRATRLNKASCSGWSVGVFLSLVAVPFYFSKKRRKGKGWKPPSRSSNKLEKQKRDNVCGKVEGLFSIFQKEV